MHFDDRLATVLRNRATGERAARTQFRQLIDLLGERPQAGNPSLKAAAYLRLIALAEAIPAKTRAAIVGEAGWRFRNPELVRWFGEAAPAVSAAALYRANLTGEEWEVLIPKLPIRARGFLRHRRDLPPEAVRVLDQLGVQDRALPLPEAAQADAIELPEFLPIDIGHDIEPLEIGLDDTELTVAAPPTDGTPPENTAPVDDPIGLGIEPSENETPPPLSREPKPFVLTPANDAEDAGAATTPAAITPSPAVADNDGVRALVQRIAAFKRAREERGDGTGDPRLPLGEPPPARKPLTSFSFGTDSDGRIDWAEPDIAPMVVGIDLAARCDRGGDGPDIARAFLNRQPVRGAMLSLDGAPQISGDWIVDATPRFTRSEGRFYGYVGRCRRAAAARELAEMAEADRVRQLLHELRTPVNAVQGFAEVIQQQIFGPTPHEYRALAATIAGDAARMLAGFDELDRLARLESGAMDLDQGSSDFAAIARRQITQLQTVLTPRLARFVVDESDDTAAPLALAQNEAEVLAWRVLATLAAATGAGEQVSLTLTTDNGTADRGQVELAAQLPVALRQAQDIFASDTRTSGGAVNAGIFGAGFSLRLARAEARAAGGDLTRVDDILVLSLPLLTPQGRVPSPAPMANGTAG